MVTKRKVGDLLVALATLAGVVACSAGAENQKPFSSANARPGETRTASGDVAPHRPWVRCDGTSSVADLLEAKPSGTIAITAVVPEATPTITNLGSSEIRAEYPLREVKQVAGPPTELLPRQVSALLAQASVAIFLPPGSYLLVVYPEREAGSWSVLTGLPGEFQIVATTSAQQRCMVPDVPLGASSGDVIKAANGAPRGPVEPLSDVIAALETRLK